MKNNIKILLCIGIICILVLGIFDATSTGKHSDKLNIKETTVIETTTKTTNEPLTQNKKEKNKTDKIVDELEKEAESEIKADEKQNQKTDKNSKNKPTEEVKVEENNNDEGWSPMVKIER